MLFPDPRSFVMHLANVLGALGVGLFFAFLGLNAASGCGQGGQCIEVHDLFGQPAATEQLAERLPQGRG